MFGSVREALPYVREWTGGPLRSLEVVGRPSRMSGSGRESCLMSGSGRKAIPNVREWSGEPPGCPGVFEGPPGCPGVFEGPPGCPGVVKSPYQMSGSGRKALQDDQE